MVCSFFDDCTSDTFIQCLDDRLTERTSLCINWRRYETINEDVNKTNTTAARTDLSGFHMTIALSMASVLIPAATNQYRACCGCCGV